MTAVKELDAAIAAHGFWKSRLRQAIDTGTLAMSVDKIAADNVCDFGKWLMTNIVDARGKANPYYRTVKDLHAAFHRTAARVVQLALQGDKAEAERMLAFGGEYAVASAKLTSAMMEWRKAAQEAPALA